MNKKVRDMYIVKAVLVISILCLPALSSYAFAASTSTPLFQFGGLFKRVSSLVSGIIVPIGILVSGWKIAYLALVCGVMGIDPLSMMPDNSTNWSYVWTRIKFHLSGFVKGLFWVAGVWSIFNLILYIVSALADGISTMVIS